MSSCDAQRHSNVPCDERKKSIPSSALSWSIHEGVEGTGARESDAGAADIEKQSNPTNENENENNDAAKDANLVEWDDDDVENPMNFGTTRKWCITLALGFLTLAITFASSIFSTTTIVTAKLYGVSEEVMVLGTSLVVAGFAVGPLLWGPLSEIFGRKRPLFFGYFVFIIFQIPVAVARNLETVLLARFFQGVFGSAPLGIVGGALADIWEPVHRGLAVCTFAGATFLGPVFGPIIGGFVTESHLGWRWTAWITMILASPVFLLGLYVIPETYAPVLLSRRAARMRYETRNWALHAKRDESPVNARAIVETYLFRPFKMLFLEPILDLITVYVSLVYGILYLFFESYPASFQRERGWSNGIGSLPFLAIIVGVVVGAVVVAYFTLTRFARQLELTGSVVPEERLPPMMIGAFVLPAGLFWFAWTSDAHISWVPQVLSGIPIGCGVYMIFMQSINYIIDVYVMYANSAMAANTFVRSLIGAGFPMFAVPMYRNLGVAWATSLLAFLAVAMAPVPILFFHFGARIRRLSRYSP